MNRHAVPGRNIGIPLFRVKAVLEKISNIPSQGAFDRFESFLVTRIVPIIIGNGLLFD